MKPVAVAGNPAIPLRREDRVIAFRRRCQEAIAACDQGPKSDAEHNCLALDLGRPDLARDIDPELPLGAA